MHPVVVLEEVRYLIFELLHHLVDALLPRRFVVFLLLNGDEELAQSALRSLLETDRHLKRNGVNAAEWMDEFALTLI